MGLLSVLFINYLGLFSFLVFPVTSSRFMLYMAWQRPLPRCPCCPCIALAHICCSAQPPTQAVTHLSCHLLLLRNLAVSCLMAPYVLRITFHFSASISLSLPPCSRALLPCFLPPQPSRFHLSQIVFSLAFPCFRGKAVPLLSKMNCPISKYTQSCLL